MEFEFLEVLNKIVFIYGLDTDKLTKEKIIVRKNDVLENKKRLICHINDFEDISIDNCPITDEYFLILKIKRDRFNVHEKNFECTKHTIVLVYDNCDSCRIDAHHLADYIDSKTGKTHFQLQLHII